MITSKNAYTEKSLFTLHIFCCNKKFTVVKQ